MTTKEDNFISCRDPGDENDSKIEIDQKYIDYDFKQFVKDINKFTVPTAPEGAEVGDWETVD